MSKKHFEAVARVLASQCTMNYDRWQAVESIAKGLADVFAAENPRFNRALFLKACGIEEQ